VANHIVPVACGLVLGGCSIQYRLEVDPTDQMTEKKTEISQLGTTNN
jgi:hypothetical protein